MPLKFRQEFPHVLYPSIFCQQNLFGIFNQNIGNNPQDLKVKTESIKPHLTHGSQVVLISPTLF